MTIHAYKYQGAGNDFVIIDGREKDPGLSVEQVKLLCDRRFGIGGDGLMILGKSNRHDFSMRYFNSDGYEGTMCGNGGRCLVAFAAHKGIEKFEFTASDGYHKAYMLRTSPHRCIVKLKMKDIDKYTRYSQSAFFLDTGSPHYVEFVSDVENYQVDEKGYYWRHHPDFKGGTNVNFVEILNKMIKVRTFERGVEAETFACGTGVTASAIATYLYSPERGHSMRRKREDSGSCEEAEYNIKAVGGELSVSFSYNMQSNTFSEVYLTGPATFVFETDIEL